MSASPTLRHAFFAAVLVLFPRLCLSGDQAAMLYYRLPIGDQGASDSGFGLRLDRHGRTDADILGHKHGRYLDLEFGDRGIEAWRIRGISSDRIRSKWRRLQSRGKDMDLSSASPQPPADAPQPFSLPHDSASSLDLMLPERLDLRLGAPPN